MQKIIGLVALVGAFTTLTAYQVAADPWSWNTSYGHSSFFSRGLGARHPEIISIDLDPQNLKNTSFRIASREGRLNDVERLLSQGAEIDSRTDTGETALMFASRNCSTKLAKYLVQHGANINAADQSGKTPLIFASRESCAPVVSLLLKTSGIELNNRDITKRTAFDYAGENSMLEVGGPSQQIMQLIDSARRRHKKS